MVPVPVAERSATVGASIEQKSCDAVPVGADGSAIVTVTSSRVADSHEPTVCDA